MYYNNFMYVNYDIVPDIRTQEVKKLLGLFPNNSIIYLDKNNNLYALEDFTILFCVNLNFNNADIIDYDLAFDLSYYDKENSEYLINEKNALFFMRNKIDEFNVSKGKLLVHKQNVELDPEFIELLKLKAGDGLKFYKVLDNNLQRTFALPVFSRFPSLNKGDTIDIMVNEDLLDNRKIIYTMNIFKKKYNRVVTISCRLLNII